MIVQDINNPNPEENYKAKEEIKEEYLAYFKLNGEDNGHFGTIKTNLENKMTCGLKSYSKIITKLWDYSTTLM